ncbi:hypothetical protein [Paenibacillus terrigena]|uniref:hypothetical protein n=1 Tax=Paenibacillus terrigena TaxID=369333 RepID=UPI00036835B0|nr:hypothetical protein [Paenibacillus terrigena]
MIDTKIILVEGLPGSGKSTTAQFISQCLSDSGIANKWWYEEEEGHPVYMFNDDESMKEVINDLANGDYQKVVNNALEQWRRFSDSLMRIDQVILIDSTFLGYLTWTLFPLDVPVNEIEKYLAEVERIISPWKPALIYFHQRDVHNSLKKICDKRGDTTTERFIQNASESKYGIARKLVGFDGMVSFWKDYRHFTNSIIEKTRMRKLSIENSEGDWDKYLLEIMEFLEISMSKKVVIRTEDMDSYTGIYKCGEMICEVYRMNNELYMNGIQQIWPNSRLLPRMKNQFEVESLPIKVTFSSTKIHMEGPRLFDGSVEKVFSKGGDSTTC